MIRSRGFGFLEPNAGVGGSGGVVEKSWGVDEGSVDGDEVEAVEEVPSKSVRE